MTRELKPALASVPHQRVELNENLIDGLIEILWECDHGPLELVQTTTKSGGRHLYVNEIKRPHRNYHVARGSGRVTLIGG